MKISHFFIDRPIFASVIAIVIIILGGVAYTRLPVAQYPEIAPPTINVVGQYPGASAETVAETVEGPDLFHLPLGALGPGRRRVGRIPVEQVLAAMDSNAEPVAADAGDVGAVRRLAERCHLPAGEQRSLHLPT